MDIYYKIVKMYKNFRLTEEERKEILGMHESHGYKKPVNEQIISYTKGENFDVVISTKDRKYLPYVTNPSGILKNYGMYVDKKTNKIYTYRTWVGNDVELPKAGNIEGVKSAKLKEDANEFMKFITDDVSRQKFIELQQKNPTFLAYLLNEYKVQENTHRKIKKKKIFIEDSTTVKEVPPPTQVQPTETIEPGVEIFTDRNVARPNLFQNNEAILTTQFTNYINESIMSAVNELKQNLADKGGTGMGVLDSMKIYSSSSRTRNGQSRTVENDGTNCAINPATKQPFAACPTHLTLSKARAEAAKRYMIDLLKKNRIEVDESKIEINFQGQNGDGTSGPEFNPQTDKASDEKFQIAQRVDVDCVIAIRTKPDVKTKTTPPEEKATEPTTETDYKVRITGREKGQIELDLTFSFDFLKIRLPGFRSNRGSRAALRQVRCSNPR